MNIIKIGDPCLMKIAKPVNNFNSQSLRNLIKTLFKVRGMYGGVGLAAPQIGISKRVLVYEVDNNPRYPDAPKIPKTVLINPKILIFSKTKNNYFEGCLSIPNIRGEVPRSNCITYQYQTFDGTMQKKKAYGFEARVIQHEVDHLDGKLFLSKMKDLTTLRYDLR